MKDTHIMCMYTSISFWCIYTHRKSFSDFENLNVCTNPTSCQKNIYIYTHISMPPYAFVYLAKASVTSNIARTGQLRVQTGQIPVCTYMDYIINTNLCIYIWYEYQYINIFFYMKILLLRIEILIKCGSGGASFLFIDIRKH